MKGRLPILIGCFVLALAVFGAVAVMQLRQAPSPTVATVDIGGPFQLVDTTGRPVTEKTLLGKPTAVFFGFTYCPEVCPTTLTELSAALNALGRDADKLNVVLVSVDPERDTPEQMKLYLSNFDSRIQGFTGTPQAVAQAAKAYRVYYKKVSMDGGDYTVDHSSAVYLFDKKGRFVEPIAHGAPHERVVAQLKKLVTQG